MSFKATIEYQVMLDDLAKYRKVAGYTREEVASITGFSPAKVKRGESGTNVISLEDLNIYMELYKVPKADRVRLRNLRSQISQQKDRWWESYTWISPGYAETIQAEDVALSIRTMQCAFVPGLLQTEAYVRHMSRAFGRNDEDRLNEIVEVRERRKAILSKSKAVSFGALLAESVLSIGTKDVLRGQLQHLRDLVELPSVTLRVIRDGGGIPLVDGTCFWLPQSRKKYSVDLGGFSVVLDDSKFIERVEARMDRSLRYALNAEDTKKLIEKKIREL